MQRAFGQINKQSKLYSAIDIEKYHKGLLSPAEMHALERAALEDPLLADAMDGYAFTSNAGSDLSDLKKRLTERLIEKSATPVVPLPPALETKTFPWWRVAAAVVVLFGLGWGIYQWTARQETEHIAQSPSVDSNANPEQQLEGPASDTITSSHYSGGNGGADTLSDFKISEQNYSTQAGISTNNIGDVTANPPSVEPKQMDELVSNPRKMNLPEEQAKPVGNQNLTPDQKKLLSEQAANAQLDDQKRKTTLDRESLARQQNRSASPTAMNNTAPANNQPVNQGYFSAPPRSRALAEKSDSLKTGFFVFRGQVVDGENNPLPFTNITNRKDQVGTYADANGNFVLISTDSIMNVQTRSIGFESSQFALKDKPAGNQLVLREDQSLATRTIDTSFRIVNLARLNGNLRHEEPEPLDGWIKYDAYVANNLNVPTDYVPKDKNTSMVELSFEVDKMGQPVNIKVVRSLCRECDQEAIRLLKEGPRWKPTRKNRRTRVTISF